MDKATQSAIAKALAEAIETERHGQHFYRMAAQTTSDPKGKEVFATLAEEEAQHENYLKAQHASLAERGEIDRDATLGTGADLSGDDPIFSAALRDRIREAHFEMAALGVGVRIELASVQHYKAHAEKAPSMDVKAFLESLAEWESNHYHALLRQQESLRELYWAENDFAPF
jgi:rubrerythrin